MEIKSAKGAKPWLELTKNAAIPILKASAKLLTKQIKAGASLAEMSNTIERDPALCLHLFLAANKKSRQHNPDDGFEIISLNHVVTILGMKGLIDSVKKAPQITLHKSDAYQKAYLQAQSCSAFGGHLMEHWVKVNHVGSAEKLKWATILAGAPRWILWREAYVQMRKCDWLIRHDFVATKKAEKKVFGCALNDIICLLGRKLKLPSLAQSVLETKQLPTLNQWGQLLNNRYLDFIDDDLSLKRLRSNPTTLMAVILHMAEQLPMGWMTAKTLRSQKALCRLVGQELSVVVRQNHQLAVEVSHHAGAWPVLPPATSLLWPNQTINKAPWLRRPMLCLLPNKEEPIKAANKSKAVGVSAAGLPDVPPPRKVDKRLLADILGQFKRDVNTFSNVHEILLTCNKAIYEGLGMRRTFICILGKGGDHLRPLYSVGIPQNSKVHSLKIPLDNNRFFGKLLKKVASYRVDRDNFEQVTNMLSPEVVDVLLNKNFIVMSLFAGDKPIGIVYADASSKEEGITEQEYQAFKTICQSTGFALGAYAQKRNNHQKTKTNMRAG
jgi:hypothetical protein